MPIPYTESTFMWEYTLRVVFTKRGNAFVCVNCVQTPSAPEVFFLLLISFFFFCGPWPYFHRENRLHPVSASCHQAWFPREVYRRCAWPWRQIFPVKSTGGAPGPGGKSRKQGSNGGGGRGFPSRVFWARIRKAGGGGRERANREKSKETPQHTKRFGLRVLQRCHLPVTAGRSTGAWT